MDGLTRRLRDNHLVDSLAIAVQPCMGRALQVSGNGNVYLVDVLSRRLIVLMAAPTSFDWGESCIPAVSSSSSAAVSVSSSSSASSIVHSSAQEFTAVVVILTVLGAAAAVGGASCLLIRWRRKRQHSTNSLAMQMHERLLPSVKSPEEQSDWCWRAGSSAMKMVPSPMEVN